MVGRLKVVVELMICPCEREKRTMDDTEGKKSPRVSYFVLFLFCFFLGMNASSMIAVR